MSGFPERSTQCWGSSAAGDCGFPLSVVNDIFNPAFILKENDMLLVLGDPAKLHTLEEEAKAT